MVAVGDHLTFDTKAEASVLSLMAVERPGGVDATTLMDLPTSLLIDVLSRISDPVDIASILSTSRQFKALVATISWQLRLLPWDSEDRELKYRHTFPAAWQRAAVAMIRIRMPLTRVLDLTGASIMDDDVASLLGSLRNLDCLILDSCQKLTSSVVDALAVSVRSGPRALSLQRCFRIGPTAAGNLLAAAAADGSRLQCILLSHLDRLDLPRESPLIESQEDDVMDQHPYKSIARAPQASGLRVLALHNCGGLGTFELAAVAATCPLTELLFLGGSVEALGLSRVENLSTVRIAVATSAIVGLARSLEKLQMLELTFFTQPVVQAVREELLDGVQVWDFCEEQSLTAALCFSRGDSLKLMTLPILSNWEEVHEDVSLALRAAANCSDIRRKTPLHWAAALGEAQSATCLIEIGASTKGMKDSAGATALFVAAEYGHASVCKVLLEGGADVFAKNRAGENPIYIAALKGHSEAVEVMLSYCTMRGWNWQDVSLYGDGWTPLMAAAVADRQDVGKVLLLAAGYTFNTSNGIAASSKLLDAQNRHGQTAMHIAARRASVWFVTNLLAAGASVDIPDEYGLRALDVAIHYRHRSVIEILRQWESQHCPRKPKPKNAQTKIWRAKPTQTQQKGGGERNQAEHNQAADDRYRSTLK